MSTEYLLLKILRRLGFNTLSVLLVGEGPALATLAGIFQAHQEWGYRVAGILGTGAGRSGSKRGARLPFRVLGGISRLARVMRGHIVDEIILAVPLEKATALRPLLEAAAQIGVPVRMFMESGRDAWHLQVDNLGTQNLLVFVPHQRDPYLLILKTIMDYLGSFLILLLISPLLLAVALGIWAGMGRPIFFKQKRLGHNGRAFFLYKFRTMVADASRRQQELKHANEMGGPVFKMRHDPRVTPLGRFLRKWSLDEFPQLLNVLRGELSLVGPRPLYFFEARKVPSWARRRYSVKPGMTCLWQVMGRNRLTFQRWMELDLEYIDRWSLGLDLKILLKTIPAVLFSRGAY
jgi:exopolysaccharide biosynthesis polyprenyl glycosylphosphotransferase